ncbi:MAG: TldD/PmbA family protein [Promethearchaeota archaeon]
MGENNLSQNISIRSLADLVKSEIKKSDIDKWDIYLREEQIYSLYLRKTEPELNDSRHNLSYVIRLFKDKPDNKMGCGIVSLNSTSPEIIQKAIQKAKSILKLNIGPRYNLVEPGRKYTTLKTIDQNVWDDPEEFIKEKGKELRQQLQEIIPAKTTFGKFRVYKKQKMLLNHLGFSKLKKSTNFYYEFSFKSLQDDTDKMAEYWPAGWFKTVDQLKFDELIPEWVTMAKDALKAKKPETNPSIDVIFPPRLVRIAFLETIGYSASGRALFEKTSHLKEGDQIAVENLTVIDDGLKEDLLYSSEWDSEGCPKKTTTIIEKGIMKNFIFDQKFAQLTGRTSTGNAQRKPSRGGNINIEINNLIVEPGNISLKDLVGNSKKAIYVNKFSWLHPNSITGEFGSTIDNAYMIENGKLTRPIKGGIMSGNVYEMMRNIAGISKETRIVMNSKLPFIKFKNLRLIAN